MPREIDADADREPIEPVAGGARRFEQDARDLPLIDQNIVGPFDADI